MVCRLKLNSTAARSRGKTTGKLKGVCNKSYNNIPSRLSKDFYKDLSEDDAVLNKILKIIIFQEHTYAFVKEVICYFSVLLRQSSFMQECYFHSSKFYLIYFLNTNYSDYADFTIILEYTDFHIMHFLQKIASPEDIMKLKLMRDT